MPDLTRAELAIVCGAFVVVWFALTFALEPNAARRLRDAWRRWRR